MSLEKLNYPFLSIVMMKKILSLFVIAVAFSSCQDDVSFNSPAVQGYKDREVWQAGTYTATVGSDNSLTVVATRGYETLTLRTDDSAAGDYALGADEANTATFVFSADQVVEEYTTVDQDATGRISISANPLETDLSKGYITGTFRFQAVDSEGNELSFTSGHFYKLPVTRIP